MCVPPPSCSIYYFKGTSYLEIKYKPLDLKFSHWLIESPKVAVVFCGLDIKLSEGFLGQLQWGQVQVMCFLKQPLLRLFVVTVDGNLLQNKCWTRKATSQKTPNPQSTFNWKLKTQYLLNTEHIADSCLQLAKIKAFYIWGFFVFFKLGSWYIGQAGFEFMASLLLQLLSNAGMCATVLRQIILLQQYTSGKVYLYSMFIQLNGKNGVP